MQENANNAKMTRRYIIQIICSALIFILVIAAWHCASQWNKVSDYQYRMISRDNNVNTPQEMRQYLKMTSEDQKALCLEFLKEAEQCADDYNHCMIDVEPSDYHYQLIRDENIAVGTISNNKQHLQVYCEQGEEKTIIRIKRNDIWYETFVYNQDALIINMAQMIEDLKNVEWEYARTEWSETLKPGTENITWLNSEDYQICLLDCGHMARYVAPTQDIIFYMPGIAYAQIPDFKNATIVQVNDISEVFALDILAPNLVENK